MTVGNRISPMRPSRPRSLFPRFLFQIGTATRVRRRRLQRQPRRRQLPPLAVLLSLLVAAPPEPHGFPLPARSLQKTPKSTKKVETEAVTVTPKATRPRATRCGTRPSAQPPPAGQRC